jgi:hypothetical protein
LNQADPLRDFRNFLFVVWSHLNLPAPTKRQYEIADFLQTCPNKRRMVQAFRGVGKSWITCAYVCWRLYCDPQLNILVVSASKGKADEFVSFTKRLITEIDPPPTPSPGRQDQRWSTILFDVGPAEADPNPSVKSAGITGQITGSRADEIIADDIETPDNSMTQAMREKLAEKIKEFDSILKPLPERPHHLPRHAADRGQHLQPAPRARLRGPRVARPLPRREAAWPTYGEQARPVRSSRNSRPTRPRGAQHRRPLHRHRPREREAAIGQGDVHASVHAQHEHG